MDVSIPPSCVYFPVVIMYPCFITSDDSVKEGIAFLTIANQILLADGRIQALLFTHVLSCLGPILKKCYESQVMDEFKG